MSNSLGRRLSSEVLDIVSKFNIQDTLPELQHEFCALWDKIVLKVETDDSRAIAHDIHKRLRSVFISLHQSTDASLTNLSAFIGGRDLRQPPSYPLCNIREHLLGLTRHDHEVSPPTTAARDVRYDGPPLAPASASTWSNVPSSSITVPLCVEETPADVLPLNNIASVPLLAVSSRLAQKTFGSHHVLAASPSLTTAHATQRNDPSGC